MVVVQREDFKEMTDLDDLICDKLIDILNMDINNSYAIKFNPRFRRSRHLGGSKPQVCQLIRRLVQTDDIKRAVIDFLSMDLIKSTNKSDHHLLAPDQARTQFSHYLEFLYDNKHMVAYFQNDKQYRHLSFKDKKNRFFEHWMAHYQANARIKKDLKFIKAFAVPRNRLKWLSLWCNPVDDMDAMRYWILAMEHVERYMRLYVANPGYEINETARYKYFLKLLGTATKSMTHHESPEKSVSIQPDIEAPNSRSFPVSHLAHPIQSPTDSLHMVPTSFNNDVGQSPPSRVDVDSLKDPEARLSQSACCISALETPLVVAFDDDDVSSMEISQAGQVDASSAPSIVPKESFDRSLEEPDTDFSLIALQDYRTGEAIYGCSGLMVPVPEDILNVFARDFSVVYLPRKKESYLLLGPIRFINHDCSPNVQFDIKGDNVQVTVIRNIGFGEEILVDYGPHYFGLKNEDCLCSTCELQQRGSFSRLKALGLWAPPRPVTSDLETAKIATAKSSLEWLLAAGWYKPLPKGFTNGTEVSVLKDKQDTLMHALAAFTSDAPPPPPRAPKKRRFQLRADQVETRVFPLLSTDPTKTKTLKDLEGRQICYYCRINHVKEYKAWNLCHRCFRHQSIFGCYWPQRLPPTYENY